MTRITARAASEMLDVCPPWDRVKIAQTVDLDHGPDRAVLAASAHELAREVVRLHAEGATARHELRRVIATLTRERGELIDQEEAAVENDDHDEASECGAQVEGLDRAIQLLRPLAWPDPCVMRPDQPHVCRRPDHDDRHGKTHQPEEES
ncbi:hypothetical protein M3B38_01820 [Dietzia cinnamea]|uniref:hypothetical protein n=1 Tax=Dietzia cinnamea TaxID=321318 RepID=UPI0021A7E12D|nr:hypothetical protein [Dietzia cinnamea]MCT1710725.1 hypothetical protein [Dietzia cinnamea]